MLLRSAISLVLSGDRTWLLWRRNWVGRQKNIETGIWCAIKAARSAAKAGMLAHHLKRKKSDSRKLWKSPAKKQTGNEANGGRYRIRILG
jgi:hypothetical protein